MRHFFGTSLLATLFDRSEQSLTGEFAILRLRPRILHGHSDSARPMTKRHRRRYLVYILSARSAGPRERFHQIDVSYAEMPQASFD